MDSRIDAYRTVEWTPAGVVLIDQRRLPAEEVYLTLRTPAEVAAAIRDMVVRGAPAIGVTAAMGVALAARAAVEAGQDPRPAVAAACLELAATRPTAVNLFWAIDRMRRCLAGLPTAPPDTLADTLAREAQSIHRADIDSCRRIGRFGQALLPDPARVLTHCNAGGLATGGYGTALGVIRAAHEAGKAVRVLADETRPFLQGARLTAWELHKLGIPVTVITDNMAGHFISRGQVDAVVVGADRIAANGDTANKIGTLMVAHLAAAYGVPFYVAAPMSTVDPATPDGAAIPIEERPDREVTHVGGTALVPEGVPVANPAFDVTPHRLVTAIVTDAGVARPPYTESLARLAAAPDRPPDPPCPIG